MSIGNLKDYGNKGNNFPYQLKVLQGLALSQLSNCDEIVFSDLNATNMKDQIDAYFTANPDKYLVSKTMVWNTVDQAYVAHLTVATLS